MRTTPHMMLFWRTDDIYSNWHPSPFTDDKKHYMNAEQYMMAAKARLFGDSETEAAILKETSPREMKALGRKIRNFSEGTWVEHRDQIMYDACLLKFSQNAKMKAELLATGDRELVEASPHDAIWGIGLEEDDPRAEDKSQWLGLNLLGKALMRTRKALGGRAARSSADVQEDMPLLKELTGLAEARRVARKPKAKHVPAAAPAPEPTETPPEPREAPPAGPSKFLFAFYDDDNSGHMDMERYYKPQKVIVVIVSKAFWDRERRPYGPYDEMDAAPPLPDGFHPVRQKGWYQVIGKTELQARDELKALDGFSESEKLRSFISGF